jgi:hypothetical protein
MFERFRERLNKVINFLYLNVFNKIKWYQVLIAIYVILYFMSIYSLLPQWFLEFTLPNGSEYSNIISLFLSLNFGYLIYIFSFIKLELFNYLINIINLLIFNDLLNYDLSVKTLDLIFEKHGFSDLVFFYILKITEFKVNYFV